WINVPVGVLGVALALLFIPDIHEERRVAFDTTGLVLSAFGLALFMTGSTTLGLDILPLPLVLMVLFAGGLLLFAYLLHSRRVAHPIIDLSLLRIPTFAQSLLGALLFRL